MSKVTSIHTGIDSPATQLGRVYLILRDATYWLDADGIADISERRWEREDRPEDIADAITELQDMGYEIESQELPGVVMQEYRMVMGGEAA